MSAGTLFLIPSPTACTQEALPALLVYVFSIRLHWLPPSGYLNPGDDLRRFLSLVTMPLATVVSSVVPIVTRMTRTTLLEVLSEDFVRTARAKGLAENLVIYKHAVINALIPMIAVVGLQMGYMFGTTVITELVFAWPGISSYLF